MKETTATGRSRSNVTARHARLVSLSPGPEGPQADIYHPTSGLFWWEDIDEEINENEPVCKRSYVFDSSTLLHAIDPAVVSLPSIEILYGSNKLRVWVVAMQKCTRGSVEEASLPSSTLHKSEYQGPTTA